MKSILDSIKNPPIEYRSLPFWAWNDKLDTSLLKHEIDEFKKAGVGGYFMHARGGLQTEYLSEEWMEAVRTCIEENKKNGMNSWIYDEVGWPSGFAGGIVTALGDEYHARGLDMIVVENLDALKEHDNVLGIYVYDSMANHIRILDTTKTDENIGEYEKLIIIKHISSPFYIDVLNEKVVKAFIECTHEEYYKVFKDEFGTGLKGFFTDEPRLSVKDIPWSYILCEKFTEKYKYNIIEKLPALFIPCEGYERVRYDFWQLVSELFVSSYMKQIHDWTEAHNCKLTGHMMMEESLYSQMTGTTGSMPFYEYMQMPGVDWLRRMISSPVVPKQVSSVANQLGKKFVLTESYALCGSNVSFEELKWIAEWQYVNGVNLMCQHLSAYTLRGLRKRDYPPSLFIQQPWWKEYSLFNDYLARLGMILTTGKNVAKVLMIHPMRSGWIAYDGTNNEYIQKLDKDFINASELLSGLHIDYHYGDETIMRKYAEAQGNILKVGECEYEAVVLPSMLTLDASTVKLLDKFISKGGTVISIGDFPALVNGVESNELKQLKEKVKNIGENKEALYNIMKEKSAPTISIKENNKELEQIHYQQRDLGNTQIFFIVNHDNENSYKAKVTINESGRIRRLMAETGEIVPMPYIQNDTSTLANIEFLPMQSYILVFDKENSSSSNVLSEDKIRVKLNDTWNIEEMDLNSITLDSCSYRIDKGEWMEPKPIIKLMDTLLALRKSCDIELKFNIEVDMDLQNNKDFFLVLEMAEQFIIEVNGKKVQYKDIGWWKDTSFKKVNIKSQIKNGQNEIILKRVFYQSEKVYEVLFGENVYETELNKLTYDVELESIYLVGDFGVISKSEYRQADRSAVFTEGPFVITDKPQRVTKGDLTLQGFCFFAGNISLSQDINLHRENNKRMIVDFGMPEVVMMKIFVNDQMVSNLLWAPYAVDITDFVKEGHNKLTVELYGSLRNLLGPHHHIRGEVYNAGPSSFKGEWSWIERKGEAFPSTEEEMQANYWNDEYCFVKFGL
jgi:hypothetical protein